MLVPGHKTLSYEKAINKNSSLAKKSFIGVQFTQNITSRAVSKMLGPTPPGVCLS
jgi:hypothetical protein